MCRRERGTPPTPLFWMRAPAAPRRRRRRRGASAAIHFWLCLFFGPKKKVASPAPAQDSIDDVSYELSISFSPV